MLSDCFKSELETIFNSIFKPTCEGFAKKVSLSFDYCFDRSVPEQSLDEELLDDIINYVMRILEEYKFCNDITYFISYLGKWSKGLPGSQKLYKYFNGRIKKLISARPSTLKFKFSSSQIFKKYEEFIEQHEITMYGYKESSKRFSDVLSEILGNEVHPDLARLIFDDNYNLYIHQALAIEELRKPSARVVIVATPNASGKTEIGLLATMSIIAESNRNQILKSYPLILIIYPTKALARDQFDRWKKRLKNFCKEALKCDIESEGKFHLITNKLHVILLDGDTVKRLSKEMKLESITTKDGPLVTLTNPQFLLSILQSKSWKRYFGNRCLSLLILDEIHFYRAWDLTLLIKILEPSIIGYYMCRSGSGTEFKVLMLSATMGDPDKFKHQIMDAWNIKDVTIVKSELGNKTDVKRKHIYVIKINEDRIIESLIIEFMKELFDRAYSPGDVDKTLIFVPNRNTADRLTQELRNIAVRYKSKGFKPIIVDRHLGDMALWERENVEHNFKEGETRILITVKTLEVGIDIGDVVRVIHWGLPPSLNDVIQREGRTGRRPGGEYESLFIVRTAYDEAMVKNYLSLLNTVAKKLSLEGIMKYTFTPIINLNAAIIRRLDKYIEGVGPTKTLTDFLK
jgi:ATP-dependent helicase YprA (DUF1998 family)